MSRFLKYHLVWLYNGIVPNLFGYNMITWQWWAYVVTSLLLINMHAEERNTP